MRTLVNRFPALIALTIILTLAALIGAVLAEGVAVENVRPGSFDICDYCADAHGPTTNKACRLDGEPYYYYTFDRDAVSACLQTYFGVGYKAPLESLALSRGFTP
ncbi:MAG: hypothetical protein LBK46_07940 [Oscillospiraceae bacterium]|jgi:hypothetical protein|nr:hypothetical protein [Oscillospiraceae bacterium]